MDNKYITHYINNGVGVYRFEKVVYHNPVDPEGNKLPENKRYKKIKRSNIRTKTLAKRYFEEAHSKAIEEIKGRLLDKNNGYHLTLREAHELTINIDVSEGTKKKYISVFKNYIEPFFDVDDDVSKSLSSSSIDNWIANIIYIFNNGYFADKTRFLYISRAKNVFEYAVKKRKLDPDILDRIRIKPSMNHNKNIDHRKIWTKQEINLFLSSFTNEDFIYKVFYTIMERGLRFNEARGLKVKDIFSKGKKEHKTYHINIHRQTVNGSARTTKAPKSRKSFRTIFISKELYYQIQKVISDKNLKPNDFLFQAEGTNSIINTKIIRAKFHEYKNKVLPEKSDMRPHYFRHRIATDAILNNKDIAIVARHLGDTVQVVLDTYVIPASSTETLLDI
ncbi:MAG: tyrosine-type recombinase/integrase [Candidatus Woesearchaeota archaeon]